VTRFRKKPVEIDAALLTWDTWSEVCELLGDAMPTKAHGVYVSPHTGQPFAEGESGGDDAEIGLLIVTLEGEMLGRQGDWIIRGVQGEFYPCKPDIFAATYELVEAPHGD
jgi:hypothetical protein